ncbi:hypothetical protein OHR68_13445 [Spirillospora sp. NBC_00431]
MTVRFGAIGAVGEGDALARQRAASGAAIDRQPDGGGGLADDFGLGAADDDGLVEARRELGRGDDYLGAGIETDCYRHVMNRLERLNLLHKIFKET